MKRASCIIFICAAISFNTELLVGSTKKTNKFSIVVEPKWENLEKNNFKQLFTDKWVLAGDITFKKKAPDFITLAELHLTWKGKRIEHLLGSLFEKGNYGDFMPIEKNLICDSRWKSSEQKLILKFKKPKTLHTVNQLALVLTVPKDIEKVLRDGYFEIEASTLPQPYKEYVTQHHVKLALSS